MENGCRVPTGRTLAELYFKMVQVRLVADSADEGGCGVDLSRALSFDNPVEAGDGGDGRVFLATVSSKFSIKLDTVEVTRIARSRRNMYTLLAHVTDPVASFLARLDQHVVSVVKSNVRTWFEHSMNKNLVDEYYRRTSEVGNHGRISGRFVLLSDVPPPETLEVSSGARLNLQLVGLQFRQQYFTCVWQLISHRALSGRRRIPAFTQAYSFEDDMEQQDNEDEDIGPSAEERHTICTSLMSRLEELERACQMRLDNARDMIATLAAGSNDLGVVADIEARLDEQLT